MAKPERNKATRMAKSELIDHLNFQGTVSSRHSLERVNFSNFDSSFNVPDYFIAMSNSEPIITVNDRPPPGADDLWLDEVIRKAGQPPPKGYPISYELEIVTKKETDQSIQVDPSLLYQCPNNDQFYPNGIRSALGLSLNTLLSGVPLTIDERRRVELSSILKQFRTRYRLIFFIIAILALVDLIVSGYHMVNGPKLSFMLQILLVIVSFAQFMVSSEATEESTLFELTPSTPPHQIQSIVRKTLTPIISMISIEFALLIFTCVQRFLQTRPLTFDVILLTITLAAKITLLLTLLIVTRNLRSTFDRVIGRSF